mmetsp:Transcript_31537/g.69078  ORF Transcript_31537/g.69078 Transcript_31537/m.69078 type:complete len:554 (+) Transcript_31537:90-1751(+)
MACVATTFTKAAVADFPFTGKLTRAAASRIAKVTAGIVIAVSARLTCDDIELWFILIVLAVFALGKEAKKQPNTNTKKVHRKDSEVMLETPRMLKGLGLCAGPTFTQVFGQAKKGKTVVIMAVFCIMLVLARFMQKEIEVAFVLLGSLGFALRQIQLKVRPSSANTREFSDDRVPVVQKRNRRPREIEADKKSVKTERKKRDVQPIEQVKLLSSDWEAEVEELLSQIGMTPDCEKLVQRLVDAAKEALSPLIPNVEVSGYSAGNPMLNNAFSHAMPRIKVVAKATSEQILKIAEARHKSPLPTEGREVDEYAIRVFTRQLVSEAGFMFGRTAFSMDEVWTVLRVPLTLGLCPETVTIALSVNSDTPLHSATLLTECSKLDRRVAPLCLLVRRWTRDRGIQYASQGHFPAYAWNLITVFFLQVSGESILPPIAEGFSAKTVGDIQGQNSSKSVAALFKDLIAFYARDFDWQREDIRVRLGVRGKRTDMAPLLEKPFVEDPFCVKRNVGANMTPVGAERLREELQRADQLCSRDASLKELLYLWAPAVELGQGNS